MATTKAESTQFTHNGVPFNTVLTEFGSSAAATTVYVASEYLEA